MGGLPCAKVIIDQRNALVQIMDCMSASIQLWSHERQPTDDHEKLFIEAAGKVAEIASEIEAYMSDGQDNTTTASGR